MIQVERTSIEGLLLLGPQVFRDDRGHFQETFNEEDFRAATGITLPFVQDNESLSHAGVLRGLHFQLPPHAQGKLVRVARGAVLDVAVDIRQDSPTSGKHVAVRLDASSKKMLWIPPGFAHGFLALEDDTLFLYKCTAYYHRPSERTIPWNDPGLGIDWGIDAPLISPKDLVGEPFHLRSVPHRP